MGRRGIKEYRAAEALLLITADRDMQTLVCPTCSTPSIERTPTRDSGEIAGRVTLQCGDCGRVASYVDRSGMGSLTPESPRTTVG